MLSLLPRPVRLDVDSGTQPSGAAGPSFARTMSGEVSPPIRAEAVNEEPVLAAVRMGYRRMVDAWNESNLNPSAKTILLVVGLLAALPFFPYILGTSAYLLILYICYRMVRSIVLLFWVPQGRAAAPYYGPPRPASPQQAGSPGWHGSPAAPAPAGRQQPQDPRGYRPGRLKESAVEALVLKPVRERMAELLGSLFGSALVILTMTVVMLLINSFRGGMPSLAEGSWLELAGYAAWLAVVGIAGAWVVLVPAKFWEGIRGEPMIRRFLLMVTGLGLGAGAWIAATLFQVDLPHDPRAAGPHYVSVQGFYDAGGRPLLMAYMAVFATLFFAVRWWRQADPLRPTRLSIFAVFACALAAWLTAAVWGFPWTWLTMTASSVSVSVQLASPWIHPRKRRLRDNAR